MYGYNDSFKLYVHRLFFQNLRKNRKFITTQQLQQNTTITMIKSNGAQCVFVLIFKHSEQTRFFFWIHQEYHYHHQHHHCPFYHHTINITVWLFCGCCCLVCYRRKSNRKISPIDSLCVIINFNPLFQQQNIMQSFVWNGERNEMKFRFHFHFWKWHGNVFSSD